MSLKRKRGPGHAVIDAAKRGGDPARNAALENIMSQTPPGKLIANQELHFKSNKSSADHMKKIRTGQRDSNHIHSLLGKYHGKPRNHVKSYLNTFFPE